MSATLQKKSIFETHIGFPTKLAEQFDMVMASGSIWSPLSFERIVRAKDSKRFDAHDVPDGIGYLATANSSSFSEAMEFAVATRRLIGPNELARVEIKEIIGVNNDLFEYDQQRPNIANITPPGFNMISDFPQFEAHISVKRADGASIKDAELEKKPLQADFRFNEYVVTNGEKKGIFTMFHDSAEKMFGETHSVAEALRRKLPNGYIVKTLMERILFCASF